jgi:adenylate kinase family enzyme
MNKGIIILGSVGSGKSHFEEELCRWTDFQEPELFNRLDPDNWVENENHEFYNNPLKASNYMYKTVIPNIMELPMNFILQNTGANINTLRKIIDNQHYQFKIVIVYCNPIISFIRNFSRERKVSKQIVLENWLKVYLQIEEYTKLVGEDNIYIYKTEYTKEEQEILDKNNEFGCVLNILKGRKDGSSFKKESTRYSYVQEMDKHKKFMLILHKVDLKLEELRANNNFLTPIGIDKIYIKEEINKWISK